MIRSYSKDQQLGRADKSKEKECVKCGSKQVVNNTYSLCNDHNQERLHGKSWREDKIAKAKPIKSKPITTSTKKKDSSTKSLKRPNTFSCSDGSRITQSKIDSEYMKVIKMIDITREPVCESCGRGDRPLSHSHTISRARAKQLGKAELTFDENNIVLECYEEATSNPTACHNIWENGTISHKMTLKTWSNKLSLIKEYDIEQYLKIMQEI